MTFPTNLGDLAAGADPSRLALVDLRVPDAPRPVTFGELEAVADGIAETLTRHGLAPGSAVAILSGNRWEYVAAYYGIMRAGFVAVPVNVRFPADTIAYILEAAGAAFAFVDATHADLPGPAITTLDFDADTLPVAGQPFATVPPTPGDVAQILFTSGSTGRPKGVPLSHAGQLWALEEARRLTPADPAPHTLRHVVVQPLFHMNGLFLTKAATLGQGSLVMLPAFNGRTYLEAIAAWGITNITAVPTMLARAFREADLLERLDLSRVRSVRVGSAPVTLAQLERIGTVFRNATVSNGYGTTEAGPFVFGPHPDGKPTPLLSVGYPLASGETKLVGDGPDQGVLCMRNPAVMTGYLHLPEVNARVLQDGWYVSGDVFRRDAEGFHFFVGRADDMFVCSGENIYPADVEKMLERHPAVLQACVVPLPDEERGQMPVAFVVPRPGTSPGVDEIRLFALAHAPAYQHPRRVLFMPDLPWAGTNKLDRAALITRARSLEQEGGWSG